MSAEVDRPLPAVPRALAGRLRELALLRAALAAASAGEPRIVVIQGEPGAGKSRLARECEDLAARAGFQVAPGRFVEGSPVPFRAFAEGLAPQLKRAGLVQPETLGEGAGAIRRLLGEEPGIPQERLARDGALATAFARGAHLLAARRPLLLVFDDLQWADREAIAAFLHLALAMADSGQLEPFPAIVLAVCRPPQPHTVLATALARLRREPATTTIELPGLSEPEAAEYVRLALSAPCAPGFLQDLVRVTGGNPLSLGEALRELSSREALVVREGQLTALVSAEDLGLSREPVEAVAARVEALDSSAREVLTLLALMGDEAPFARLALVAGRSPDAILESLDAAIDAGLVREAAGALRFSHPLVREACARLAGPARRRRLHLGIARALLTAEPAAAVEIATHLLRAGALAEAGSIGPHAAHAGLDLLEHAAYGEAARMFEAALADGPFLVSLAGPERALIELRAAIAHYRNMDVPLSRERFTTALAYFRDAGDLEHWGDALEGLIRSGLAHGAMRVGEIEDAALYEEFSRAAGGRSLPALGNVMAEWSEALRNARDTRAAAVAREAIAIGEETGDALVALHGCVALGLAEGLRLEPAAALSHCREGLDHAARLADPWYAGWALLNIPVNLHALGRLAEAEQAARASLANARETHDWANHAFALAALAVIALQRGEFDRGEELAAESALMMRRADYPSAAVLLYPALAWARCLRGGWDEALDACALLEEATSPVAAAAFRLLVAALRGDAAAVRAQVTANPRRAAWTAAADQFTLAAAAPRVDLAAVLGLPELATFPAEAAGEALAKGNVLSPGHGFVLERLLGVAALGSGDADEAESHLRRAVSVAAECCAAPEGVLAQLELAGLLTRRDDPHLRPEVASLLAGALRVAGELAMAPAVARARELAALAGLQIELAEGHAFYPDGLSETEASVLFELAAGRAPEETADALLLAPRTVGAAIEAIAAKAGVHDQAAARDYLARHGLASPEQTVAAPATAPVAPAASLRVLMFSDIVRSSTINERVGDQRWHEVLSIHDAILRDAVGRHGGTVVKHMGDGCFASFPSATGAVRCALAAQDRFPLTIPGVEGEPIAIRVGLHAGEAIAADGDLFGLAVSMTSRICSRAGAGEVLASEQVHQLTTPGDAAFIARGRCALRGITRRVRLYSVTLPGV